MTQGTILLVEDNPDDVDLTLRAFKRNRIANTVKVARDGAEALDMLYPRLPAEDFELPTIIILDLNLPKVPGLEVLRRIREHETTRLLPVVVLTTSTEEADVIRGYELGANAYVKKPVAFEEFLSAAGNLGLFWLLLNVSPTDRLY